MSTINGESQPIIIDEEYSNNGGIALFSTNAGGTVSGGSSEEGSYNSIFRIYWTITYDGGTSYTGGITGNSWHKENSLSPFHNAIDSEIWVAAQDGNLSEYFGPWNTATSDEEKVDFLDVISGCYKLSLGG